jgi:hypothetical protein
MNSSIKFLDACVVNEVVINGKPLSNAMVLAMVMCCELVEAKQLSHIDTKIHLIKIVRGLTGWGLYECHQIAKLFLMRGQLYSLGMHIMFE